MGQEFKCWSVRRLKASPTPPCGIFNINYQRQAGHSHHFVVVLSCLVLLSCLVISEYQKVNKDDWLMLSVIYFWNPLSNCDSSEKVLKSFKEVGLAKSEKKLHPYFSYDPKCHIFSKSSHQMWLSEKATKYFKEVNCTVNQKVGPRGKKSGLHC